MEAEYIKESHINAISALAKDVNNIDFVNALPEPIRKIWQDKLVERAEKLPKGIDIFNSYDPMLLGAFKRVVREDTAKINYLDIVNAFGKGLTPTQAQDLLIMIDERLRKDNPLSMPYIKRAHDRIDALEKNNMPISGIEKPQVGSPPEEMMMYQNALDQMHEEIDKRAKDGITPEQMRDYTLELVKPATEEYAQGVVNKFLRSLTFADVRSGLPSSRTTQMSLIEQLPPDAQTEWNKAKLQNVRPDYFLEIFRAKHKKLTPEIAKWYLDLTGDIDEAKRLTKRDGYYE